MCHWKVSKSICFMKAETKIKICALTNSWFPLTFETLEPINQVCYDFPFSLDHCLSRVSEHVHQCSFLSSRMTLINIPSSCHRWLMNIHFSCHRWLSWIFLSLVTDDSHADSTNFTNIKFVKIREILTYFKIRKNS